MNWLTSDISKIAEELGRLAGVRASQLGMTVEDCFGHGRTFLGNIEHWEARMEGEIDIGDE